MAGSKSDDYNDRDKSRRGDREKQNTTNARDRSPVKSKKAVEKRVIVSNIPYEFRWQELKDLFRQEVGEVIYVELFTDENEKSKGCGVIEFDTPETAQKAIEKMHRYELKGRKLVVKEETPAERERYMKGRSGGAGGAGGGVGVGGNVGVPNVARWDQNTSSPTSKWGNTYGLSPAFLDSLNITGPLISKVFVANLDYKVDEKKLRDVFKLAGRVLSVDLALDKDGKSRGFGTVEYEHPVEAVQAISMLHNQMLYDRRINVRMDKSNERADGPPKLPDGLRSIGMGLGVNGAPLTDVARNLPSLNLSNVQPAASLGTDNSSSTLAAIGTAALATLGNNQLGNKLLEMVVGNQLNSGPASDIGLRSSNLGTFSSSLGGGGGPANSSSSTGFLSGVNSMQYSSGPTSSLPSRNYNSLSGLVGGTVGSTGGLYSDYDFKAGSHHMDRTLPVGGLRRSDTVLVSNLPPTTTWQVLRDHFHDVGDIKFVDMKTKDTGIIRFSTEREAERAITLFDNTRFDGRIIDVTFY